MASETRTAKDIFAELIGSVPSEQWEQRLAELCGDDTQLRNRVRALLRAHVEPGSFLDGPAAGISATADFQTAGSQIGAQIGPYKLLQEIGEGGMGTVYMAEQAEPVQRKVALKIIKPGMDSRKVVARFEAERQALALMDHPNIAKILDAGTVGQGSGFGVQDSGGGSDTLTSPRRVASGDPALSQREREIGVGRPYFVMELVKGVSIIQYCDQNRLKP